MILEIIKKWEKKGFLIGFHSIVDKGEDRWVGAIRVIGHTDYIKPEDSNKARKSFKTIEETISACVEVCENYKEPKKELPTRIFSPAKKKTTSKKKK